MQVLVKVPHTLENGMMGEFRITGNVPVFYLDLTRRLFPSVKEIPTKDNSEELIEASKSDWFREMEAKTTPGDALRSLRTMREMRQSELAAKIGVKPRQISDMEHGRAPIGKKMAMKLGEALNMNYKHFL
ncbi:MAG: helix-turn-helix domain-containing protein [Fibromonadaceae bacterium]|jgi:ribosome-binding protein aMBF1 (putative translation factor)|nr:helix-turn-helix domain-containing protein [Fibromonadaceae bacterium]